MTKGEKFMAIVLDGKIESDTDGMINICWGRPNDITFAAWIGQTAWTLTQIVGFFRWQTLMLNGHIDFNEYNQYFPIFRKKIYANIA
jgi:hypothetical protein